MSKKCGLLTGLVVGAGLGVLFAPKKGSETRKELADKLSELLEEAKQIKYEDVKESVEKKVKALKKELEDLDKEKVEKIAKDKAKAIKQKAEDLYETAKIKGTPALEKAANEVREKTIEVLNNTAKKLEKKEPKKSK